MDSVHYWYRKLYDGFLKRFDLDCYVNDQFSYTYPHYLFTVVNRRPGALSKTVVFFDQEPMYSDFFSELSERLASDDPSTRWCHAPFTGRILVTSEKSSIVDHFCRGRRFKNVYYFFHATAALDWYRNHWKQDIKVKFEHEYLYVAFQHLINPKRLHRLDFMCRLHEKDLVKKGLISFVPPALSELETMISQNPDFSEKSLKIFNDQKNNLTKRYIDTEEVNGALSTNVNVAESQRAWVQVVTETVFYSDKLHLTEKIFKPIVCKQPFILLGAPRNLAYLKSYGFKTFSDFWNEDYDLIEDHSERIAAVVKILEELSSLSDAELTKMKMAMAEILEYNFKHFYHDLKYIVADEFVKNMQVAFRESNIKSTDSDWQDLYKILTF